MPVYQPFRIVYQEGKNTICLPANNRRGAVKEARPLLRKGYEVMGQQFSEDYGEWRTDTDLQNMLQEVIVNPITRPRGQGSIDTYVSMTTLAAILTKLAPFARKRPLNAVELADVSNALLEVTTELGIKFNDLDEEGEYPENTSRGYLEGEEENA